MLSSLARPDGRYLVGTLNRVGRSYPHALYYSLRTAYLEFRTPLQQVVPPSSSGSTPRPGIARTMSSVALESMTRSLLADRDRQATEKTGEDSPVPTPSKRPRMDEGEIESEASASASAPAGTPIDGKRNTHIYIYKIVK